MSLVLNIGSGFLQKSYDIIGQMENFVVLKLNAGGTSQEYRTKIVSGKKQAPITWNESITINVPRNAWSSAVLEVYIMDQDVTSDELCGYGKINLEHCGFFQQQGATIPYHIRLYSQDKSQASGQLSFTSTLR